MEEGSGADRISKLPEPILHHIQSLLDLKQAVTTSELSKTWNTVWSTLPFLNFDENYFRPRSGRSFQNIDTNNWKLVAFIDKTLHHRERTGLRILKFEISTQDLDDIYHSTWIRWIHCLTVCNIDELVIKQPHYSNRILLPPGLLTIESLTSLSLRGCKLPFPSIDQVKLPNLRKLSLEAIDIDDQLVGYFISICHKLEYLLVESHRIKQLHISGLPYLKILIAKGVEDVRVEASNLQELTFHYVRPPLINPAYCGNALKCLSVAWVTVKDNGWFSRLISNLHVLETLSLDSVSHNDLQISSSSLTHLDLCKPRTQFEAKINAPNLRSFKYKGELLNLLLTNCLAISRVEIWITDSCIQGYMIIKLIQLLGKFNHSQVVKLSTTSFKIPVELRKVLLPPLPNVKHLMCCGIIPSPGNQVTCCGIIPSPGNQVTQVLDSFFWLSSRLEVVSLAVESVGRSFAVSAPHFSKYFMITLKLMYGDDLKEDKVEESCYCVSLPLRCWRHSLKMVEIEKFRCLRYYHEDVVQTIKNYFMANSSSTSKSEASCIFTERHVSKLFYPAEYPFPV